MRSTLAAVMLMLISRWQGARFPATWQEWLPFAALAVFSSAVPFVLLGFAQQRIDSGLAAILVATTPMFTVLFGLRSAGRPPAASQWLGIALGLGGVVALVGYDSLATLGAATLPQLVVLFVAVCYAFGIRVAARTYGYAPTVSGACTLSLASLILWPISLAVEAPWSIRPTADSWMALVLLVLLGSVAASVLYYQVIRMAGATFVSLSTYLNPPVAIVAGVIVLGEDLALSALAAMLMILAGVALVGRRPA
jgi:drug/metabolite transporter (DMT)-like permease